MKKLNLEKYLYLPIKFHEKHHCCIELVRQMEEFIIGEDYNDLRTTRLNITEDEIKKAGETKNAFECLENLGRMDEFSFLAKKHLILGIISDSCYFMQEALESSLKARLVVTYSLLRRPLVYNIKIILRILFDANFMSSFINEDDFDAARICDEKLKQYLILSDKYRLISTIKGEDIYDIIFNSKNKGAIINLSNKAMHPSTIKQIANKTEKMNLNFVFMTHEDNIAQWASLYTMLLPILIFYVDLINVLIFSIYDMPKDVFTKHFQKTVDIVSKIYPLPSN